MNVLFATGSPARYMLPPMLSDRQVNCGPDWLDQRGPDGRVLSLVTPVGRYDLAAIAVKLPLDQQPDVVVCLVDASWRNLPSNLAAFSCPKVLLIADTHHLNSPLLGTLRYMAAEPFDRCVLLYDRHHAAFFHATGFRNLFWLPGLTFPHGDAAVRAARVRGARASRIAFVGQSGKYHPRRTRLLAALKQRKLPVEAVAVSQAEALGFYGSSLLGFNASLNGDFNLRVLEILSAGGALLTDGLAPEAGFERLFADRRDCLIYRSPEELAERAAHALAHPAETRAIGAAGARWFDEQYNEVRRRELFRAIAFDGVAAPEFSFSSEETTRVFFGGDTDRLLESLVVYEGIQEIHRNEETVRLQIADEEPADLRSIFSTLPRVQCATAVSEGVADLAIFNRSRLAQGVAFNAPLLWCWDASSTDFGLLARGLGPAGYALASENVALFCRQVSPESLTQNGVPASSDRSAAVSDRDAAERVSLVHASLKADGPPRLSICIPTFNRAQCLGALLNSLVHQCARFPGQVEIIVSDDAAGDETRKMVEDYRAHFPITYSSNPKEVGLARNFGLLALPLSSGMFTWIIGDSDLVRQNAVETILEVIAQHPEIHFIYTNSSPRSMEEYATKARGGIVSSDAFPVNGPTQAPAAAGRSLVRFDDLLELVYEEEIQGAIGCALFRTETWRNFCATVTPHDSAAVTAEISCPQATVFANTMVGRAAYFVSFPLRITFGETRTKLARPPRVVLQHLPEVLALYEAKGISPKQIARCREALVKVAREPLHAVLLDATLPGFAEFDLRKFVSDNHVVAHVIFDYLDDILREAGLRPVKNRLLDDAQELIRQYPSSRIFPVTTAGAGAQKNAEAFQASLKKAEEFLRAGAVQEAVGELVRAKNCAPDAAGVAKADHVLAMLMSPPPPAPAPSSPGGEQLPPVENVFSAEERDNMLGIIAAFAEDPSNAETLSQLRALQTGLADFVKAAEPARIPALFRGDFGQIYQEIVALQLGEDPSVSASVDLSSAVAAGFSAAAGSPGFDPRPLLSHLLFTSNASRTQKSHVYQ